MASLGQAYDEPKALHRKQAVLQLRGLLHHLHQGVDVQLQGLLHHLDAAWSEGQESFVGQGEGCSLLQHLDVAHKVRHGARGLLVGWG